MSSQEPVQYDDSAMLDRALAEYWQRVEDGESVDLERFLQKHSDYREQLESVIRADESIARIPLVASISQSAATILLNRSDSHVGTRAGTRLGDFHLIREIGRGGMGVVYEAHQISLDRKVAVKVLPAEAMLDASRRARFRNEAMAVAQLQHPNIVPVYTVGDANGSHFFAMQLIRGETLAAIVKDIRQQVRTRSNESTTRNAASAETAPEVGDAREPGSSDSAAGLSANDYPEPTRTRRYATGNSRYFRSVARVGVEVARALDHAHSAGIRHRDVKPSNLMVDTNGHIWVTDFGLAQIQTTDGPTQTGDLLGTLRYMSPEQASGRPGLVDHRTDIYSLGATLYELLSLKHVVEGKSPPAILRDVAFANPTPLRQHNPRIPDDLEKIVAKSISRDPQDRYETAAELADDLQRFLDGTPIRARKPTLARRFRDWTRRHPLLLSASAIGVVITMLTSVVAGAAIFDAYQKEKEERKNAETALSESEGSRLLANSALQLNHNPGLALLLAIEGAERAPGLEANSALLAAIDANHERATIRTPTVIRHIAASPDGRTLAACQFATRDQPPPSVLIYDIQERAVIKELATDGLYVSATFDKTGQHLLLTGEPSDKQPAPPTLYDTATWARVRSFAGYDTTRAKPNTFSPDGRQLILCSRNRGSAIVGTGSGVVEVPLQDNERQIVRACFDQTGQRVASVFEDGSTTVWSSKTGQIERRIPPPRAAKDGVAEVQFLPGGKYLAVSRWTGTHFYPLDANGDAPNGRFSHAELRSVSETQQFAVLAARGHSLATVIDTTSLEQVCVIEARSRILDASIRNDFVLLHCAGSDAEPVDIHDATTGELVASLNGHRGNLADVTFGSTSESIITSGLDRTLRIWSRVSGREKRNLGGVGTLGPRNLAYQTSGFRFSDDGESLCVARPMELSTELRDIENDAAVIGQRLVGRATHQALQPECQTLITFRGRSAYAWDAKTQRLLRSTVLPERVLDTFATSSRAVIMSVSGQVWLWDFRASEVVRLTDVTEPAVVCVAGSRVALGTASGAIRVIDAASGMTVKRLQHPARIKVIRLSDDGKRLMVVDSARTVRIWPLNQGEPIDIVPKTHRVHEALFVKGGSAVLTFANSIKQPLGLWNAETGQSIEQRDYGGLQIAECVGPNVLLCPVNAAPVLWNTRTGETHQLGKAPCRLATMHENAVATVHDSTRTQEDAESTVATLQVWKTDTGELVHTEPLDFRPSSMQRSPAGDRILITRTGFSVDVLSSTTHQHVATTVDHPEQIVALNFSETAGRLLTASIDGNLRFHDSQGRLMKTVRAHNRQITAADTSPDATLTVTGDIDGKLMLWDNTRQQKERELKAHAATIRSIQFRHNQFVVTVDTDGRVQVFDLRRQQPFSYEHPDGVNYAELSSDQHSLLVQTGGRRKSRTAPRGAFVIDIRNGNTRKLASQDAMSCRFSPAGQSISIVQASGVVNIYDAESLKERHEFSVPGAQIRAASFDPQQNRIITLHEAGISTWSLDTGQELFRTAFGSEFLPRASTQILQTWSPLSPSTDQVLLQQGGKLLVYPLEPLSEAKKAAPRSLSDGEAARYRVPIKATNGRAAVGEPANK